MYQHWLREHNAKVIVVDPGRTETATSADLHLQVRPGSDAALAFAMLHIMKEESLVDETYIKNHVQGYEEVLPSIENCTPEWGQSETGIPTTLIEQAARSYARGPSRLWLGQGLRKEAALGHGAGRIDVAPVVYEEVNDLAMAVANGLPKQGAAIRSPFGGQCGDLGDPRR